MKPFPPKCIDSTYATAYRTNLYYYKLRNRPLQAFFGLSKLFGFFIKKIRKTHRFFSSGNTNRMKKRRHLPDFAELCPPEQNHITNTISLEIFFFFLCSIAGFLWEVLLMYYLTGSYVNRGFFYGPWLPIYGSGGVLFHLLLGNKDYYAQAASSGINFRKQTPFFPRFLGIFVLTALLGTSIEFSLGWFLDTFLNLRYWDYSTYPMQFRGYICLFSSLGFGFAGALWICIFSNFFRRLWFCISIKNRRNLNAFLLLLFALDCAASLILPNTGYGITFP